VSADYDDGYDKGFQDGTEAGFQRFLRERFLLAPPGEGVAFITEDGRVGRIDRFEDTSQVSGYGHSVTWAEDYGTD